MISFFGESFQRHRRLYLLFIAIVGIATAWAGYRYFHKVRYKGISRIQIDMRNPDMLLATRNLAELPKDVASAPMLQGLVDEELVFHYEEDEARLSLEGSLRRLAYEHNLELQDHLLSAVLSAPAKIGIWRSSKGRPEHYVVALERNALGKLVEALARIAMDDRQLKQAGSFNIGGKTLPLLTLDIGGGRTLAFIAAGDRWVFMSDPALALDGENKLTADAAEILGDLIHGKHPWQGKLPAQESGKHSFVIGRKALTMNYAHFLPALEGLRLNHDGKRWNPELRINAQTLPEQYDIKGKLAALWRNLPANAALCAAVPVNWKQTAAPVKELAQDDAAVTATINALDPIGAICWFAGSRFNAPLFVAQAQSDLPAESTKVLTAIASKAWSVGATEDKAGEAERFAASVPSLHGLRHDSAQERSFEPALARHGKVLYFSPDRRHVDAALAVATKKAPALGDLAGMQGAPVWLFYDPQRLGKLTRAEVQEVLPADEESFFRDVARQRLWPRLEAWGQKQTAAALASGQASGDGFVALDFLNVGNRSKATQ